MTRFLLTAFDPFGGDADNASMTCARLVRAPRGTELFLREVPTVFARCRDTMARLLEETRPDAVLCLGQAAGRTAVTIERAALNLMDARIPDNAGARPRDLPIRPGGPDGLFATLPTRAMLEAALGAGVPAALSYTAGTFVCNCLMYETLYLIRERSLPVRAGFVHIPSLSEQGKAGFSLPAAGAAAAVERMLERVARTAG